MFRNPLLNGKNAVTTATLNSSPPYQSTGTSSAQTVTKLVSSFEDRQILLYVRAGLIFCALLLGATQSWAMRHEVISDGISYVEIASHYAHGEFWEALNSYWSPFFSLLIAAAMVVLRPSPYWHVATMHLVIFLAYAVSLFSFDFLMGELLHIRSEYPDDGVTKPIPIVAVYITAFSGLMLVTWSYINFWFCSPDMVAVGLLFILFGLLLKIRRTGGTTLQLILFGVVAAFSYLNRTAFLPAYLSWFVVVVAILWRNKSKALRGALIITASALLVGSPFAIGISLKTHQLTVGDSGKLNYSWELDGAHRWIHWQGEPFDIGHPKHPTKQVLQSPKTFTFGSPINASYPPWYAPAYWYEGIQPHVNLKRQAQAFTVNLSVFLQLLFRSPILLPLLPFIIFARDRTWIKTFLSFWPVLIPSLVTVGLYMMVYMEKRYVAGNILLFWVLPLVSIRFVPGTLSKIARFVLPAISLGVAVAYAGTRFRGPVHETVRDLIQGHEKTQNVNFLIADSLHAKGLCKGDKVAYIGPGINADWARLAGVRIVAEVPLMYGRIQNLRNNLHVDDPAQILAFFNSDVDSKNRVLQAFRDAGAKVVVTDGFFSGKLSDSWAPIIRSGDPRSPKFFKDVWSQVNSRYLWLGNESGLSGKQGACPSGGTQ